MGLVILIEEPLHQENPYHKEQVLHDIILKTEPALLVRQRHKEEIRKETIL